MCEELSSNEHSVCFVQLQFPPLAGGFFHLQRNPANTNQLTFDWMPIGSFDQQFR